MKKFFEEFKTFITRGNVLDMAVGVIVGGAFTSIVNGLTNNVLKPLINWLLALVLGEGGLDGAVTILSQGYDANGAKSLANSIYIDWGAFISAIINFLLIAIVLFTIVKIINKVKENNDKFALNIKKGILTKEQKKELKSAGIKLTDKKAIEEFYAKKEEEKRLADEKAKLEAEEKAKAERLANPTTEDLLKQILQKMDGKKD